MKIERKIILGGLTSRQVSSLPPDIRKARTEYIRETYDEMCSLRYDSDVVELRADHPDKEVWWPNNHHGRKPTESFDAMEERGWQFDGDGNVYPPSEEDW